MPVLFWPNMLNSMVNAGTHTRLCAHITIYTHTHIHIYVHVYIYVYIYIYIHTHTHMHRYIHICTHVHARAHTHIHVHIILYIYICVCVCVCVGPKANLLSMNLFWWSIELPSLFCFDWGICLPCVLNPIRWEIGHRIYPELSIWKISGLWLIGLWNPFFGYFKGRKGSEPSLFSLVKKVAKIVIIPPHLLPVLAILSISVAEILICWCNVLAPPPNIIQMTCGLCTSCTSGKKF